MAYQKPNKDNKQTAFMHLTNFSINKENPNFKQVKVDQVDLKTKAQLSNAQEDRNSHKRSILDFFSELKDNGYNTRRIWRKIQEIVVKTISSVQPVLKHNYYSCHPDDPYGQTCFEVLGFDVLIDDRQNPYLLEVNHSPSFRVSSAVDLKVKHGLIRDTFQLLNLDVKARQKLILLQQKNQKIRTLTGKRIKLNRGEVKEQCVGERDEYAMMNLGGFERIYPPESKKLLGYYDSILREAEAIYHEFTGAGDCYKLKERPSNGGKESAGSESHHERSDRKMRESFTSSVRRARKIYGGGSFVSRKKPKHRRPSGSTEFMREGYIMRDRIIQYRENFQNHTTAGEHFDDGSGLEEQESSWNRGLDLRFGNEKMSTYDSRELQNLIKLEYIASKGGSRVENEELEASGGGGGDQRSGSKQKGSGVDINIEDGVGVSEAVPAPTRASASGLEALCVGSTLKKQYNLLGKKVSQKVENSSKLKLLDQKIGKRVQSCYASRRGAGIKVRPSSNAKGLSRIGLRGFKKKIEENRDRESFRVIGASSFYKPAKRSYSSVRRGSRRQKKQGRLLNRSKRSQNPYIAWDPYKSFEKTYKERMKSLGIRLVGASEIKNI